MPKPSGHWEQPQSALEPVELGVTELVLLVQLPLFGCALQLKLIVTRVLSRQNSLATAVLAIAYDSSHGVRRWSNPAIQSGEFSSIGFSASGFPFLDLSTLMIPIVEISPMFATMDNRP